MEIDQNKLIQNLLNRIAELTFENAMLKSTKEPKETDDNGRKNGET